MVKSTGVRYKPGPPSKTMFQALVFSFIVYSIGVGYMVAIKPDGSGWRLFSWHPFLMTLGFVGMFGIGAVTKKLGGYTNTKLHAIFSWLGNFMALGGLYAIYQNKENMGKPHLQSSHSILGAFVIVGCIMSGMAGGIFLHPDFGIAKTNKTIRFAHKMFSRLTIMLAWTTMIYGLLQISTDLPTLAIFALPLFAFAPLSLL